MQRMSRAQRILVMYLLMKSQEPRVIKKIIRNYGSGIGKHGNDMHTSSFISTKYTDAEAIAAVEAASLTLANDLDFDNNDVLNAKTYQFNEDFMFRIKATNDYVELLNKAGDTYKSLILQELRVRADLLPAFNKSNDLGSAPNFYWRDLELWGNIIWDRLPWDYLGYDHTNNRFNFYIDSTIETYIDATGVKTDQLDELTGSNGVAIPTAGDVTFIAGKALYNADHIELDEITTPTAVADHGKVYTKNDNKLYFQDGAGTEHEVAFV